MNTISIMLHEAHYAHMTQILEALLDHGDDAGCTDHHFGGLTVSHLRCILAYQEV